MDYKSKWIAYPSGCLNLNFSTAPGPLFLGHIYTYSKNTNQHLMTHSVSPLWQKKIWGRRGSFTLFRIHSDNVQHCPRSLGVEFVPTQAVSWFLSAAEPDFLTQQADMKVTLRTCKYIGLNPLLTT